MTQVSNIMRSRHYSLSTEKSYSHWIKCYIFFHKERHPLEIGLDEVGEEVKRGLSHISGYLWLDGQPALRWWTEADGMRTTAHQRH